MCAQDQPIDQSIVFSRFQYGGQSLSIGIVGPNVLVPEDTLRPRVPSGDARDTQGLSTEMVVAKVCTVNAILLNFEVIAFFVENFFCRHMSMKCHEKTCLTCPV